ncbi:MULTISPECIES: hypothetical protein [unclassified Microbacterium]|uniref:hypothetical protein n=1 Tax=unclassified Microbacterium TaxID=2609290 RepID=UPI003018FBFD
MSDVSGTTPDEPIGPEGAEAPMEIGTPEEPLIPPADVVIPPPPPEIPVPDGLLAPPPAEIPPADAVIPAPPPETRRRSAEHRRATPAARDEDQPSAAADDWALPSVAPEVPTSGSYRVLTVVIFAILILLLVAAVGVGIFLLNTVGLPFAGAAADLALTPPL